LIKKQAKQTKAPPIFSVALILNSQIHYATKTKLQAILSQRYEQEQESEKQPI